MAYAPAEWTLTRDSQLSNLTHQQLPHCTLKLQPGGGGVGGPAVSDRVSFAGLTWRTTDWLVDRWLIYWPEREGLDLWFALQVDRQAAAEAQACRTAAETGAGRPLVFTDVRASTAEISALPAISTTAAQDTVIRFNQSGLHNSPDETRRNSTRLLGCGDPATEPREGVLAQQQPGGDLRPHGPWQRWGLSSVAALLVSCWGWWPLHHADERGWGPPTSW